MHSRKFGFDGIPEIRSAHGYLVHQYLQDVVDAMGV